MNFMEYVEMHSVRVPFSGCSIWTGAITEGGYGRSLVAQRLHGTTIVHRAVYQHLYGPVQSGMYVCHQCDTPACNNPDHLFIGTPSDNASDRSLKGRSASRKGAVNGRAKLVEADVIRIRELLKSGAAPAELAKRYSVSDTAIRHIQHQFSWSHI